MEHFNKYLKYKNKYLALKNQLRNNQKGGFVDPKFQNLNVEKYLNQITSVIDHHQKLYQQLSPQLNEIYTDFNEYDTLNNAQQNNNERAKSELLTNLYKKIDKLPNSGGVNMIYHDNSILTLKKYESAYYIPDLLLTYGFKKEYFELSKLINGFIAYYKTSIIYKYITRIEDLFGKNIRNIYIDLHYVYTEEAMPYGSDDEQLPEDAKTFRYTEKQFKTTYESLEPLSLTLEPVKRSELEWISKGLEKINEKIKNIYKIYEKETQIQTAKNNLAGEVNNALNSGAAAAREPCEKITDISKSNISELLVKLKEIRERCKTNDVNAFIKLMNKNRMEHIFNLPKIGLTVGDINILCAQDAQSLQKATDGIPIDSLEKLVKDEKYLTEAFRKALKAIIKDKNVVKY
jgi:hypothetical protein